MNRITLIFLLAAILAVAALTAVLVSFLANVPSSIFQGERSIDLGVKEVHGEPAVFTGQFALRNTAGTAIHILGLRPSCGCLQVELPRKVIPAGETLMIPLIMTLERHGKKDVFIDIILPEERIERLTVHAEARETYNIAVAPRELRLSPDEPAVIAVIVEVFDGENPPPLPALDAPGGILVQFSDWSELQARTMGGMNTRRWRGEIEVAMNPEAHLVHPGVLKVTIGAKDSKSVQLLMPDDP